MQAVEKAEGYSTEGQVAHSVAQAQASVSTRLLANVWLTAALIFFSTRAVALSGAYLGVTGLIEAEPSRNKGWLAELALMWDAAWYAGIAQSGYQYDPAASGGTNVAFAPLYPLLVRSLSELLNIVSLGWDWGNRQYGATIAAGLLISNISFYLALVLLIRLLRAQVGARGAALAALGLASLPTAFFFSALYTEGLFLLLATLSFATARSDLRLKWLFAGLFGLLAALTKFAGLLLLPVLAIEYLQQKHWRWRAVRPQALWLGLIPLGLAAYVGFLWWQFGTPLALSDSQQKGWNHQPSFFLFTYWESAEQLLNSLLGNYAPAQDPVLYYGNGSRLYLVLDLALPLLLLVGAIIARRNLKPSDWAWLLLGIVYPLSTNITFSLARYVLPLWPGLLWLGTLQRRWRWLAAAFTCVSLALLAWCSYIYGSARWIG